MSLVLKLQRYMTSSRVLVIAIQQCQSPPLMEIIHPPPRSRITTPSKPQSPTLIVTTIPCSLFALRLVATQVTFVVGAMMEGL